MVSSVTVRHGNDPAKIAYEAMAKVFMDDALGKTVLLKPNTGFKGPAKSGLCTHPEVIRGLIKFFWDQGARKIYVGDSSIMGVDSWEALESAGIKSVCEEMGAICVNLDEFPAVEKTIPNGVVVDKLRFSSPVFDVDFVISVPVIKTHMYTVATLSIKNMKGCLYRREKTKLHRISKESPDKSKGLTLDYGIADMASVCLPDYALIDGTVCMEGFGPSGGTPQNLNLVVAGKDPVAADMVAVRLMGMPWDAVPHINLTREKYNRAKAEDITVDPEDFMKYGKSFLLPSAGQVKYKYPNINIVEKGACSGCSAALMAFLRDHGAEFKNNLGFTLAAGKDLKEQDLLCDRTFLIGNCTAEHRGEKPFCPGCPPVSSRIITAIRGENPESE